MNAELSDSLSATPADYVRHGWLLVAVRAGSKRPRHKVWNQRENCITDPERATAWQGNIGLAHAYSRTCAIDFDRLDDATKWLKAHGIDADERLNAFDAVRISSGRPNRAKLLYRLHTPLQSLKLADGALEFRCGTRDGATIQDLLPPSIHPDTHQPYQWEYPEPMIGHWSMLPVIPPALLELWKFLIASSPSPPNPAHAAAHGDFPRLEVALTKRNPDCGYDEWIQAGMALHHESGGSEEGFRIWDNWSKQGTKKYRGADDLRTHWRSFSSERGKAVVTAASILRGVPASVDEFTGDEADANRQRFVVILDHQFVERTPLTWHVKGVLPKAELAVVFGASGSGKSFFVFDLAAAIATGTLWQGRKTTKGRVVFVLAEGATGFRNRLLAYAKTHAGSFPGVCIIDSAPDLLGEQDHMLLAKEIEASGGADLVIIDTLAASSPGADENAAKDMGKVIEHCKRLHKATAATVLLIHHSGKDESKGARGWSGLRAAADAEIEVNRNSDYRTAKVTKLKDGEDGAQFAFKLVPVVVGIDEDGEPFTSCVVEPAALPGPEGASKLPKPGSIPRTVLDLLSDLAGIDGRASTDAIIQAALRRIPEPETGKRDLRRQHINRALQSLASTGFISVEGKECQLLHHAP